MDGVPLLPNPGGADELRGYIRTHPCKGFKPVPYFSVTGNMLRVYFEDEEGYAETLNEQVTVIRAFSDKRVVGVKLFEVPELIEAARKEHH